MKPVQLAIAIDQLFNTLAGGYADETISARLWRNRDRSWWWKFWQVAIDTGFFWTPDHCYNSYLNEIARSQFPKEYRNAS